MTRAFLILLFLGRFTFAHAQVQVQLSDEERKYFTAIEDTLTRYIKLSVTAHGDAEKNMINDAFSKLLEEALEAEHSGSYPFDSLVKFKMMLRAPDEEVRLITWNVPMDDESYWYCGFIQRMDPVTKKWSVFKLTDRSDEIKKPEDASLNADKWYGCYYFRVVETYYEDKRYYTLLGWDGYSKLTQKKIIDILYFNSAGEPQFGDAIFEVKKLVGKTDKEITVWQKRVIYEFKQHAVMALDFDESKHLIIYEHLSPEESWQKGQYQYYLPDLGTDGFKFKKGKWEFVKDAKVRNNRTNVDKYYKKPTKDPNAPPER
jgi:hypothetical protein